MNPLTFLVTMMIGLLPAAHAERGRRVNAVYDSATRSACSDSSGWPRAIEGAVALAAKECFSVGGVAEYAVTHRSQRSRPDFRDNVCTAKVVAYCKVPRQSAPAPAVTRDRRCHVPTFYEHADYAGAAFEVGENVQETHLGNKPLNHRKSWSDAVSSICIPPNDGWVVNICEHAYFGGECWNHITTDVPHLAGWNDRITSISVGRRR